MTQFWTVQGAMDVLNRLNIKEMKMNGGISRKHVKQSEYNMEIKNGKCRILILEGTDTK